MLPGSGDRLSHTCALSEDGQICADRKGLNYRVNNKNYCINTVPEAIEHCDGPKSQQLLNKNRVLVSSVCSSGGCSLQFTPSLSVLTQPLLSKGSTGSF